MKKLLSLFSVLTISGSAVPTTIAASPYQKEEKINPIVKDNKIINLETNNENVSVKKNDSIKANNENEVENEVIFLKQSITNTNKTSKLYYYNDDKTEVNYSYRLVPWGPGTSDSVWKTMVLTINMGDENPSNYKNILVVGNNRTHRRWGSWSFNGINLGDIYSGDIFYKNLINKKITKNDKNIDQYISYELMNFNDKDFLANFKGKTKIGWTWYYENGNYYLQFLMHISASVHNSNSNAHTHLRIGTGFLLN